MKTINPRAFPRRYGRPSKAASLARCRLGSAVEQEVRAAGLTEREPTILKAVARGLSS